MNLPICAVIAVLGLRLLRESRDPHAQGLPDLLGVQLMAAMPAGLSLGIVEGPKWRWSDPRVIGAFTLLRYGKAPIQLRMILRSTLTC